MRRMLSIAVILFFRVPEMVAQTASLHAVEVNGPADKRINIVFLSEGYTASSLPAFAGHVSAATNLLFSKEPWKQYRSYCNVYRIEIASNQNGTDNGLAGGTRDTYFESGFTTSNIEQLCTITAAGQVKAMNLLGSHVPDWDTAVILVNDPKYGGAGGSISIATVHGSSGLIVEHEIGHSFADLADEYDVHYPQYTPVEKVNNTAQTNRNLVKWRHWFEASTPVPTPEQWNYDGVVGVYQGSMYRTSGWYRPHLYSMMQYLGYPCGQVNREAFVLRYYSLVSPVESFVPASDFSVNASLQDVTVSFSPKVPSEGPAMTAVWEVDGVVQAGETGMSLTRLSDAIGNGNHTLKVTVSDPTPFVRSDPSSKLKQSKTWAVNLSNQMPNTLGAWRTAYGGDLTDPLKDGMVNLVKYALGIRPDLRATTEDFPKGGRFTGGEEDYLTLRIPRKWRRTDVDYIVETGDMANGWNSGPGHTVTLEDTPTVLVVRDAVPIPAASRRFIRLKVVPK